MRRFLSKLKDKVDATLLKNVRGIENTSRVMWLMTAGMLYLYVFYSESFFIRVVVAVVLTFFSIVACHIASRFRESSKDEDNDAYIYWEWHPYFLLGCLVVFTCLMWANVLLRR